MSQMREYIKIAFMNIKSNKGRSVLTMLGIIIGISSVIMIISIGNGVKDQINGELNDMAGGQVYLSVDQNQKEELVEFTLEDFEALEEKVDHIKGVTPNYGMWGDVSGRKGNFEAIINAGTHSLQYSIKDPIIRGRYFSEGDYYSGNKVCVLTESGARNLFGTTDVIGMNVDISLYGVTQEMTVIGIRKDSESSMLSMGGSPSRVNIEMPLSVLGSVYGFYVEGFDSVLIIADSAEYATDVAKSCMNILELRHNIRGKNIIQVENFNDYMTQIGSVLNMVTLFVVLVAAISLLVGGIGVMNIMLVSVTERTREIGIRKALGARTASIMMQFLSESAIITLVGGCIGILIGILGAVGICSLIGMSAKVQLTTILGASVFSSAVGIFFGIYPAKKAARLSPIEALRHE